MNNSSIKFFVYFIIINTVILSSNISVYAQDIIDVKGWNNTTWGMTEDNLTELFKGKIIDTKDKKSRDGKTYRNLKLETYEIDGVKFKVLFEMGVKDDKLKQVRLVCIPALPSFFSKFEQLLINKYGQPKSRDESQNRGSMDKTASWFYPSTKIELIFSFTRGLGSVLNILYTDQNFTKQDTDKL